ncbi:hypothetical protein BDS110ZK25_09810 [Bradyrhizobium diazoefficiens]|uniref:Uncharacterized protein n=1 Tax=Bradyrhizobium diazoefficiens TaxID=1355477 RepID=A0A810CQV1_9BRAD|nr:hypothetical protein XF1B_31710 [Bradyrhizobium diazoefficiens]BCE29312.1 hypothetical protein XF2B_30810 [Bradyrhizobium diazoefficiens]BCE38055.1 hypothetical protein XF3B_30860 [Bradyrhizobium diazoefficiens]BCE72921.1 hypothetical protein XF8B_30320 [Bradyrhizobium diazoefficiens]BCE90263.1 hypothetical protein XF10B_30610 [Bradyrhizobium diazoefficiens]
MGEVHDVHQAEDQREADGDQSVEQAHEQAARETLDNGLSCQKSSPTIRPHPEERAAARVSKDGPTLVLRDASYARSSG